ncbi:hypothetical protein P691DRAFT_40924 [Macrolepiota fuliginosa MF-IS2]|uniref:Uncharacterized protein n=1 Tax=Macrolepiota fuliginosa MF-IS2 TaxID=1400762 RepID=A0A9P5XM68_9AGAR|nr:hypothetical protein P691DRAFT_40924 [Macrolepiota fuliginosa MF-IS2]
MVVVVVVGVVEVGDALDRICASDLKISGIKSIKSQPEGRGLSVLSLFYQDSFFFSRPFLGTWGKRQLKGLGER